MWNWEICNNLSKLAAPNAPEFSDFRCSKTNISCIRTKEYLNLNVEDVWRKIVAPKKCTQSHINHNLLDICRREDSSRVENKQKYITHELIRTKITQLPLELAQMCKCKPHESWTMRWRDRAKSAQLAKSPWVLIAPVGQNMKAYWTKFSNGV